MGDAVVTDAHKVYGPPGTGKTTFLVRQIDRAREKYGDNGVMAVSFTRAGAHELANRAGLEKSKSVGTLHSVARAALGAPRLADDKKARKAWSEHCAAVGAAHWDLKGAAIDDEAAGTIRGGRGDQLRNKVDTYRAKLTPREKWDPEALAWFMEWSKWKKDLNVLDFTDLIEQAIEQRAEPGPMVEVGFFDEAQDFSRLEWELVRQLSRGLKVSICVGDDDQTLYEFKGASAEDFLGHPGEVRTLSQSWRVPRKVHTFAERWIKDCEVRAPKEYKPRDAEGTLGFCPAGFGAEHGLADMVQDCLERGTVMVLASCSYMLSGLAAELRRRGVPFWNPYKADNGAWNPLRRSGTSAVGRLLGLSADAPTRGQLWGIVEHLPASLLNATKKDLKSRLFGSDEPPDAWDMNALGNEVVAAMATGDPRAVVGLMSDAEAKRYAFPLAIHTAGGWGALREDPKVILGTVHSVKGGESDSVIVMPDLSNNGAREWRAGPDRVRRLFYVAATRAREELWICKPRGREAAPILDYAAGLF